jgi:ferredoxin--NADP+ reductase
MKKSTPRVAIVGSGPSGFFAADALLRSGRNVHVDMFERLPSPFGFLRYGVAPDHQKIKQVAAFFEATMRLPGYRLFANVEIGRNISLRRLREAYDGVLLVYGAADGAPLGVRGEYLRGSLSASEFVGWYNGHPDHSGLSVDLSQTVVTVIGNGNVALDVCQILASAPERLAATYIADAALTELRRSRVRSIYLIGRRGLEEASFTTAELREMVTKIEGWTVVVDPTTLATAPGVSPLPDVTERNLEILRSVKTARTIDSRRRLVFFFARSVCSIIGHSQHRVSSATYGWLSLRLKTRTCT